MTRPNKTTGKIDMDMLVVALQTHTDEGIWQLDTHTGDVLFASPQFPDEERYIVIEPIATPILPQLMRQFIDTVNQNHCRQQLKQALDRNQSDWHFKQVLANYREIEDDWYAFKEQFYTQQAWQWLHDNNLDRQPTLSDVSVNQSTLLSLTIKTTPAQKVVLQQTQGQPKTRTLSAFENSHVVLAKMTINADQHRGIEQLLNPPPINMQPPHQATGIAVIVEYTTDEGVYRFDGTLTRGNWIDRLHTALSLMLGLPVINAD